MKIVHIVSKNPVRKIIPENYGKRQLEIPNLLYGKKKKKQKTLKIGNSAAQFTVFHL